MAYEIKVVRGKEKGTLTFKHGSVSVNTTCWWKLTNAIPAKTYTKCSATWMSSKKNSKGQKREGIYLPDDQTGKRGIFIHMGKNASWSDGCIVCLEEEVLKIWNAITPKNGFNVTVVVSDEAKDRRAAPTPAIHRAGPYRVAFPDSEHFGPGCRISDFDRMSWFKSFL